MENEKKSEDELTYSQRLMKFKELLDAEGITTDKYVSLDNLYEDVFNVDLAKREKNLEFGIKALRNLNKVYDEFDEQIEKSGRKVGRVTELVKEGREIIKKIQFDFYAPYRKKK